MALRGFDSLGASASLHHATANSFKVSGVFRDPADFCVLIVHDADDFYEHPSIRYLPDNNFAGLTLTFDVHYSGLRTLDSPRFATIDWPYLDVIPTAAKPVRLFDHATLVSGNHLPAAGQFTIVDNGLKEYDRLTVWYLNFAFDYIVPKVEASYNYTPGNTGDVHTLTVAGVTYSYTQLAGDDGYVIAQRLADAAGASPWVSAVRTYTQVDLRARKDDGASFVVSSSASPNSYTMYGVGAATVATRLASQINSVDWATLKIDMPISAHANGATLNLQAVRPGVDGNAISLYAVAKNTRLTVSAPVAQFSGGSSDCTWRVSLDFTALGIDTIRLAWLTFAPPVSSGAAFRDTEWEAAFTNWTLSGPDDRKKLQVAGPGSVRIEDNNAACVYSGTWNVENGFFSRGYAVRCTQKGDAVTVTYQCGSVHDLYLGTSLYKDRGGISVSLDGDTLTPYTCYLDNEPAVNTRLKIRSQVAAGKHTVTVTSTSGFFYFDFLEAVVPSDIPPPRAPRADLSPALDYSTDHTYKLSPQRLLWNFDQLGFAAPMNEYIGVFWWNQRKRVQAHIPSATCTFTGTFLTGDQIFLTIGGQSVGKTVFDNEDNTTFATHFAAFINTSFVGIWASASGNVLTLTAHSPTAAYSFDLSKSVEPKFGSTGDVVISGALTGGDPGRWEVDPAQSPALNRGAREWHADFYSECAARGRDVVSAASMELVYPPSGYAAKFPDGTEVATSVAFGGLTSSHCAFNSNVRAYQQQVFDHLAALQSAAGLKPHVQFGEFCWWYFPKQNSGMAFYDDETKSAAQAALGRPLHVFLTADDDPQLNPGDAAFLRDRLRGHIAQLVAALQASHPGMLFEVLFPYDVNYPSVVGIHNLGGRLLNFINFPNEWRAQATSGFDFLKVEALDFGSATRSTDLARNAIEFPVHLGWPQAALRYLAPVFNGGCPWRQEYRMARQAGIPYVILWAFDHVSIFNLDVSTPVRRVRSARFS